MQDTSNFTSLNKVTQWEYHFYIQKYAIIVSLRNEEIKPDMNIAKSCANMV